MAIDTLHDQTLDFLRSAGGINDQKPRGLGGGQVEVAPVDFGEESVILALEAIPF
jgi:hypothetical protein